MARMLTEDEDLVVRLSWWEKAAARRGDLRVPLSDVCRVSVEPDWWRALRGSRRRGLWIPGALCLGIRSHQGGMDFVAVRPGQAVVCVELWPAARFGLLAVSVPDAAEGTALRLRRLAPKADSSTSRRQALPVPREEPA